MLVRRYHTEEAQQNDAAEVGIPSVVCKLWETVIMIIEQRNREVGRSPRNRSRSSERPQARKIEASTSESTPKTGQAIRVHSACMSALRTTASFCKKQS